MIQIKDNQRILFIGDSITDVKWNKNVNQRFRLNSYDTYPLQVARALKKKRKGLKFFFMTQNRTKKMQKVFA